MLPPVSACPVPHRDSSDVGDLKKKKKYFISLPKKKDRFQNSLCSPNLQTAAASSFHSSSAEDLMRSRSRVCPHHHFLPQPVTYLSVLIEATRAQSASRSLSLFCTVKAFQKTACKLFYITVSPLVKAEGERHEWQKKRQRERGAGYNFYHYACVF